MAAINQVAAVHAQEVLHVERIGRRHVPSAVSHIAKHLSRDKVFRNDAKEKRQGEQRLAPVEEEHITMPLFGGIGPKTGDGRTFCNMRSESANPLFSLP